MNKKWMIAIGAGLVAGGLHVFYLHQLRQRVTGGDMRAIVVCATALDAGEEFAASHVAIREIPEGYVDDRVVPASRVEEIVGVQLAVRVEEGQLLTWTDFEARREGTKTDLATYVEAGKRAMAIPVNSALSMGGLLRPGHRVDILGYFEGDRMKGTEQRALTLLQNITVLATGDRMGNHEEFGSSYGTVTLSVGLEEGELLSLASQNGRLFLVLRGYQDLKVVAQVPDVRMADVFKSDRRSAGRNKKNTQDFTKERRVERIVEKR